MTLKDKFYQRANQFKKIEEHLLKENIKKGLYGKANEMEHYISGLGMMQQLYNLMLSEEEGKDDS